MAPKKKKNNKEKQETVKVNRNVSKCCTCKVSLLVASVIAVLIGLASYQVYACVTSVPELPQLDLNQWWGPNTTKPQDTSIRPYRVLFTDAMQEGMRWLFDSYRRRPTVKSLTESWDYGVQYNDFAQLFSFWQFKYPFRERVRYLNKYDHFKTRIQGLDIHFVHVKPKVEKNIKVFPILLLHGWPSTFRDFFEVIPVLTTLQPGYDFVFEVIVPSLPGYIYSQASTKRGMSTPEIAVLMKNLMNRIGHDKFYIHCGDIGYAIGSNMATIFPDQVLGLHTNFPVNLSKMGQLFGIFESVWSNIIGGETSGKVYSLSEKMEVFLKETGPLHMLTTKPDTIGYIMQDSPVGLAAYLFDRYKSFTNSSIKEPPEGGLESISNTDILDNIMLYWLTGSTTTAMRLHKQIIENSEKEQILARIPTPVPTWGLRAKYELIHHPDWLLRWKYPNLLGTTNLDCGGHLAALEIPKELAQDIFKAVKSFTEFYKKQ
ncbi:juvenile hormone epoxide hydrolase-like [Battus philenor]|uniref:juvenile hormone epoxide hydrolase-like n=1 Tax=Battus philenor TaxID=42288 RepID=UPI0035CF4BEA